MRESSKEDAATIIPAADSHIPEIVELWKEFLDFHKEIDPFYTRREGGEINFERFVRSLIASKDSVVLVALDGGAVVGYSVGQIGIYPPVLQLEKYGFISDIAVKAPQRRRGIGGLLLARMFDWFESRNLRRIELRVAPANKIGYSFWTKHGFEDCTHVLCMERENV